MSVWHHILCEEFVLQHFLSIRLEGAPRARRPLGVKDYETEVEYLNFTKMKNILEKDLEVVTGARKKLSTVRKESQVTHLLVQVDTDAVVPSLLLRLLVVETSVTRNVQSWGREEPA